MTAGRRAALYGAVIGLIVGFLRSALEGPSADGLYVPQTGGGLIANHIGYAIPWALAGSIIGLLIGRRQSGAPPASDPPSRAPRETTALQRFGHVLGWTGNLVAIPLVAVGLYGFAQAGGDAFVKGAVLAAGVLAFLIGRALRYIFAGSA